MNARTKTIHLTVLLGVIWAGAVGAGLHVLMKYENAPGSVGVVPVSWPIGSTIPLTKDRLTLVMAAHPQCPCTRASLNELAQAVARIQGKARVYVLFYTPSGSNRDWESADSRQIAEKIPGVTVLSDVDGVEARRFGAETSGHTFLFDRDGRLLFSGGITGSRGHSGDNAGESSLVSLINNGTSERARTFVFGCSLKDRTKQVPCLK